MKQEGMLDRFAKLFWPKEMKALVAKYEAEGTLNEGAVKCFNRFFYSNIKVMLVPILIYLTLSSVDGKALTVFSLMLIFSYLLVILFSLIILNKYNQNRFFIPYTFNKLEKGNNISIKKINPFIGGSIAGRYDVIYFYKKESNMIRNITITEKDFLNSQGNEIFIFINPYNPKYTIPRIKGWEKKYCFKKREI